MSGWMQVVWTLTTAGKLSGEWLKLTLEPLAEWMRLMPFAKCSDGGTENLEVALGGQERTGNIS